MSLLCAMGVIHHIFEALNRNVAIRDFSELLRLHIGDADEIMNVFSFSTSVRLELTALLCTWQTRNHFALTSCFMVVWTTDWFTETPCR
jgi:CDP-diglyceride synthetase